MATRAPFTVRLNAAVHNLRTGHVGYAWSGKRVVCLVCGAHNGRNGR